MPDKIIHSFQQRRQLAQELGDLAQTSNEAELLARVRQMARTYPADLLVTVLLKNLETPNSQIRGGLGHLAALLPPEEITSALRSAAANRQNGAQLRVTAALILERFLGESLSPALLGDLNQTNEVAFQSLREAVEEGFLNRHILLEYVSQMRQTNEAIAFMVMDLMERLEPQERVELYRLLALDDRPSVARTALQRLERLATQDHLALAVRSLHTLHNMLPPDLAQQTERTLRKLQFAGRGYIAPALTGWRALISPTDVGGNFSLWFVRGVTDPIQANGILLGVVLNSRAGVIQAFGAETMHAEQLPKPHNVGELVSVRTDSGEPAVLLEAPFDFARWRLRQAQAVHWQVAQPPSLPGEYRLFGDRLWEYDAPQVDPALQAYFDEEKDALTASPEELLEEVDTAAVELLAHPSMRGWLLQNRLLLQAVGPSAASLARLPLDEVVQVLLRDLDQRSEREQLLAAIASALRSQAAWLHIAGNLESAQRAHLLARVMPLLPLGQNPFLLHLLEASLRAVTQ